MTLRSPVASLVAMLRGTRPARRTALLLAGTLLAVAGCGDLLTPGKPADQAPARLSMSLVLPRFQEAPTSPSAIGLRVVSAYERSDGTVVPLDSTFVELGSAATQQVPVAIELGRCLADAQRRDATADGAACTVRLTLRLFRGTQLLDAAVLPPLRLVPGGTATVTEAVTLFEVATVQVRAGAGSPPLTAFDTLITGTTRPLVAEARDQGGATVTGRAVAWQSSNAAVLTVSSAGVVTAVSPGSASVTATIGGRTASVSFVVIPPPQRLTVVGVPGSGSGRVVSAPAGIDCTLAAGIASGSCQFDFPFGTSVQLTASQQAGSAIFGGWTGACLTSGSAPTCTLGMTEARTAGAGFTALARVRVLASAVGGVGVSSAPAGIACTLGDGSVSGSCEALFPVGTGVVLTAAEPGNARARAWTGCDETTRTTCTLALSGPDRSVSLAVDAPRTLSVSTFGGGSGVVTATGIQCGRPSALGTQCTSSFPVGATVVLTAAPQSASRFDRWVGGACDGSTAPTCAVTFGTPLVEAVTAVFEVTTVPVTLTLTGSGGGRVRANGAVVCELSAQLSTTQCIVAFPVGQSVIFTGEPLGNGQFLGFGEPCADLDVCTRVIGEGLSISANFTSAPLAVRVDVVPASGSSGRGSIFSSDQSIACEVDGANTSGICSITRARGETITVFASDFVTEGQIDLFLRWSSGPCAGSVEPQCTFVLGDQVETLRPQFGPGEYVFLYIDVFGDTASNLRVTPTISDFRPLSDCFTTRLNVEGEFCAWFVPRNTTLSLQAQASAGLFLELSDFPFCAWSGSGSTASCSWVVSQSVSGEIYAGLGELLLTARTPLPGWGHDLRRDERRGHALGVRAVSF